MGDTRVPHAFSAFAADVLPREVLRDAITAHYRVPEAECVRALLPAATLPADIVEAARTTARRLVEALRGKAVAGPVQGLVREYDLSSQEGVALMCLAEALLRIPDAATRDALIRDKIGGGDWRAHAGHSPSLFVNAATWGLVVTGKLVGQADERGLGAALSRLIARRGEPVIRRGVDLAMRMMGEQFVTGQDIAEALKRSGPIERKGYRYSYDMLGEAAMTAEDSDRYYREYEQAVHAIGRASAGRGPYAGPGISVKLSAIHPRYSRLQRPRVMRELLPRLRALTVLARSYDIGLNIDAEEAERLELSLDLLEALCHEEALAGWNGIGFVVQAYGKRAPFVIDWIIDLARRTKHRLMVRLVKGAYWDSEIKRAQQDGLEGFPVFTRKVHTDLSYLACARKLLDARDAVFPQFATHNAYSLAAINALAGPDFAEGDWEFQCLHGMGEPLYDEVVGHNRLGRPCRIYAPVGTHETLLAYLVRRLLENGANSSFVNRIADAAVSVDELIADPAAHIATSEPVGAPHPRIRLPRDLFAPLRLNSAGLDLSNEDRLRDLATTLSRAGSLSPAREGDGIREVRNPADRTDLLGHVLDAGPNAVEAALASAERGASSWAAVSSPRRAGILLDAADALEAEMPQLLGPIVREAGKSFSNAIAEVREAVDFLRYYATQARDELHEGSYRPLGPVLCISPWNFPLAIFLGQVAAALAAGNAVVAKPAEETPLIAEAAVGILHRAGVPGDALVLVQGAGEVGATLVADSRVRGVLFTGSTQVARSIQRRLAERLNPDGSPVPLIAETGGQNALVVDSSALAEQVVADVLVSAFDSAGQRCSALRVLCVQDDVAERILAMLKGALAELAVGDPARLSTDIGPVIADGARRTIEAHVAAMRAAGHPVHRASLPPGCERGSFVAPTIIEIPAMSALRDEVFGPVLHVVRFRRGEMDALLDQVNATGYALTFGVHTRIGETVERAVARAGAGNVYVNRNVIGAVVGVQPFGGHGLSGTGPKAGGPLYLRRLLAEAPRRCGLSGPGPYLLEGPVGEENVYTTQPRGTIRCLADRVPALTEQVRTALGTGNRVSVLPGRRAMLAGALHGAADRVVEEQELLPDRIDAVLFAGDAAELLAVCRALAVRDGPIVPVLTAGADGRYATELLIRETSVSTNTTAAGGNANLMMIG